MSLAGCRAGGGNVQPGTAVCCSSTADCPNAVCCYESASDQTYCRAACGAGESRVCKSTMECNGCMSASRPPLYASLMVCPP